MAYYALAMGVMATALNRSGVRPAVDLVVKFLEHFALVRRALNDCGLWNEDDGFFYDQLICPDGTTRTIEVHSMVGAIPLLATMTLDNELFSRAIQTGKRTIELFGGRTDDLSSLYEQGTLRGQGEDRRLLLGVVEVDRLDRLIARLLDESEFLSPHGLRSLSAYHRDHPYAIDVEEYKASIDYEPGESTTYMFGGNSNWRGPVWFPLNYLVCDSLERLGRYYKDDGRLEFPTGSGNFLSHEAVANELRRRLISLFLLDAEGRRPCFGDSEKFATDPRWRDNVLFHEYFHGDTGMGLGASHQTGWTGLVADLIIRVHGHGASSFRDVFVEGDQAG